MSLELTQVLREPVFLDEMTDNSCLCDVGGLCCTGGGCCQYGPVKGG